MIKAITISIIEVIVLLFFVGFQALWVFWGTLGVILGFYMMYEDINKMKQNIFSLKKKKIPAGYFFRYLMYGIILIISGIFSEKALLITFLGLFNLKIVPFISQK
jgi:hypothetical protein